MNRSFPALVTVGDTLKFTINSSPYTVTDGFSVDVNFVGPSGAPTQYTYTTTSTSDTTFDVTVLPAVTATYGEGHFNYALVATDGTDQFTIEQGTFEVELRADLNLGTDLRSHARKTLEAIEAVIERRATKDQESYTIAGRTLSRTPIRDLLELRKHYKGLVRREEGEFRYKIKARI